VRPAVEPCYLCFTLATETLEGMSEVQRWHAQNLLDVLCKSQELHVLAFPFASVARPSYHPACL
jgi:hypothetical protein